MMRTKTALMERAEVMYQVILCLVTLNGDQRVSTKSIQKKRFRISEMSVEKCRPSSAIKTSSLNKKLSSTGLKTVRTILTYCNEIHSSEPSRL